MEIKSRIYLLSAVTGRTELLRYRPGKYPWYVRGIQPRYRTVMGALRALAARGWIVT